MPLPVTYVAFDAQRRVHAYARGSRSVSYPLHTVTVADGAIRKGDTLSAGGRLKMTPDGLGLLWVSDDGTTAQDFFRVDPQTGAAAMNANRFQTFRVCHDLFVTDDSKHVVTACGTVLRSLPGTPEDLTFQATIEGVTRITHLDSHAGSNRLVVIPGADNTGAGTDADTVIRVHDAKFFNFIKTLPLPTFMAGTSAVGTAAHGRHVFVRGDGTRYHVIAAAPTFAGRRPVDAVATLDPDGAAMPAAPLPLPAETSSLAPPVERPQMVHPLAFDIVDADYSASAGRVLVASTQPQSAIHFLDPESGQSESLPVPGPVRRVVVRPDGEVAAVIFNGGVRFIDVATRATIRELSRVSQNLSFAAAPRVLLDGEPERLGWLSLDSRRDQPRGQPVRLRLVLGAGHLHPAGLLPGVRAAATPPDTNQVVNLYEGFDLGLFGDVWSSSGPAVSRFWLLDGDKRLLLDCGRVFQLSEAADRDLRYQGSLDFVDGVSHGTYVRRSIATSRSPASLRSDSSFVSSEGQLVIHDPRTLGLEARLSLAQIPGDSTAPPGAGSCSPPAAGSGFTSWPIPTRSGRPRADRGGPMNGDRVLRPWFCCAALIGRCCWWPAWPARSSDAPDGDAGDATVDRMGAGEAGFDAGRATSPARPALPRLATVPPTRTCRPDAANDSGGRRGGRPCRHRPPARRSTWPSPPARHGGVQRGRGPAGPRCRRRCAGRGARHGASRVAAGVHARPVAGQAQHAGTMVQFSGVADRGRHRGRWPLRPAQHGRRQLRSAVPERRIRGAHPAAHRCAAAARS